MHETKAFSITDQQMRVPGDMQVIMGEVTACVGGGTKEVSEV